MGWRRGDSRFAQWVLRTVEFFGGVTHLNWLTSANVIQFAGEIVLLEKFQP